jgi:hypothetical protein
VLHRVGDELKRRPQQQTVEGGVGVSDLKGRSLIPVVDRDAEGLLLAEAVEDLHGDAGLVPFAARGPLGLVDTAPTAALHRLGKCEIRFVFLKKVHLFLSGRSELHPNN